MSNNLEVLLEYYENYRNMTTINEIQVNSILQSMIEIQELDDKLVEKYNDYHEGLINRLEFYQFIYNHRVFKKVLEDCSSDPTINGLIYKIIFVELFKISMINVLIRNTENTIFQELLEQYRKNNNDMINFALEKSNKKNQVYTIILQLIDDNNHLLS